MKNKYAQISLFTLSLVLIGAGYVLSHPDSFGICEGNVFGCINQNLLFGVGHPLLLSTYLLPPFFFGLIFVRKEVFLAWAKFIPWFAVPGLYIIGATSPIGQSILDSGRTSVTESVVRILVVISILFIAWKYWRLSKKRR